MAPTTDHVRAVVARHAEATADNRVFFHPDIPEHRLASALTAYPGIAPDDVLVLLDNTETGSATEGLLLTENAIHVRNGSGQAQRLALSDLRSVELAQQSSHVLKINGVDAQTDIRVHPETMERLVAMLREVAGSTNATSAEETFASDPLGTWLESIGMGHHARLFREQRVELSHLPGLGDGDLRDMGVDALGDRRTVLVGIAALKQREGRATGSSEEKLRRDHARRFDRRCFGATVVVTVLCMGLGVYSEEPDGLLGGLILGPLVCVGAYAYSLPAAIAFRKGHRHRWAILIANWLLGLTGVAWIVLLCYAMGLFGAAPAVVLGCAATRRK